jgi:hypothetical protein
MHEWVDKLFFIDQGIKQYSLDKYD